MILILLMKIEIMVNYILQVLAWGWLKLIKSNWIDIAFE